MPGTMPTLGGLPGKSVMVKIREQKPMVATLTSTERDGVWLSGPDLMGLGAGNQGGSFFLPWQSIDWIATKD